MQSFFCSDLFNTHVILGNEGEPPARVERAGHLDSDNPRLRSLLRCYYLWPWERYLTITSLSYEWLDWLWLYSETVGGGQELRGQSSRKASSCLLQGALWGLSLGEKRREIQIDILALGCAWCESERKPHACGLCMCLCVNLWVCLCYKEVKIKVHRNLWDWETEKLKENHNLVQSYWISNSKSHPRRPVITFHRCPTQWIHTEPGSEERGLLFPAFPTQVLFSSRWHPQLAWDPAPFSPFCVCAQRFDMTPLH